MRGLFSGVHCETNINECESGPCVYGTCMDDINKYTCRCTPGYTGRHCGIDINECDSNPCMYGSSCQNAVAAYRCICPPEFDSIKYGGRQCNVELIGCIGNECKNDAQCMPYLQDEDNNIHRYTCTCQPGFTGPYCAIVTAMSMVGSSWVKYMHTHSQNISSLYISISFRTTLPDGVLFLNMGDNVAAGDYLMLYLKESMYVVLAYKNELVTRSLQLKTVNNMTLSDAQWHTVEVAFDIGSQLYFMLSHDDCPNQCRVVDQQAFTNLNSFFLGDTYFAGSELAQPNMTDIPSFVGCLQDVKVSEQWLIPSAFDETNSKLVSEGCPRTDQCQPDPCNGHGSCTDLWTTYTCQCRRPYLGTLCDLSKY